MHWDALLLCTLRLLLMDGWLFVLQDRSLEPKALKTQLATVNDEVGKISEQLERLNKNGQILAEKSQNPHEKELVQSTCANITDQLAHVRHLLEQQKMAVSLGCLK